MPHVISSSIINAQKGGNNVVNLGKGLSFGLTSLIVAIDLVCWFAGLLVCWFAGLCFIFYKYSIFLSSLVTSNYKLKLLFNIV
jgi:hypothetical protein